MNDRCTVRCPRPLLTERNPASHKSKVMAVHIAELDAVQLSILNGTDSDSMMVLAIRVPY
jgi:hypothetical protein